MCLKVLLGRAEGPARNTGECLKLAEEGNDPLAGLCGQCRLHPGPGLIVNTATILAAKTVRPPAHRLHMTRQKTGDLSTLNTLLA
jgi:hypothetical protein